MDGQQLAQALKSGRRVYGTSIISTSPHWPSVVSRLGLDFVFLDTEHIATDREKLAWMCQTYRALGLAPIVRIPAPDPYQACMALDGGAAGIIAPYIETVEQIQALRGAVKLRPLKGQRLAEALKDLNTLEPELRTYVERRCANNVLIANIESVPALNSLEKLLAVPGLDAMLVGPHDMTCSLAVPEKYDHPKFLQAMSQLIAKNRAAGVGAGITFWTSVEQEIAFAREGANLILHSSDIGAFEQTMTREFGRLRSALGDA